MVNFQNSLTVLVSIILVLSAHAFAEPWDNKELAKTLIEKDLPFLSVDDNEADLNATQLQLWFSEQRLDHFDVFSNKTFAQRYWIISQYYNREAKGPVFVVLCGKHTCEGIDRDKKFPLKLAKEFGALVLVLEHRFYGLSQPFEKKNLTVPRLRYLTVDQALADTAFFIHYVKHAANFSLAEDTKFITIGGSYAGALSAFFREKFPYLSVGAIASSPIVNSFISFPEYDEQVYNALLKSGPECAFSVQAINRYVEDQIYYRDSNSFDIREQFNASKLSNEEFLFYWADSIAILVQEGHRTEVCNLLSSYATIEAQFDALKHFIKALDVSDPTDYGAYYLSDAEFDEESSGSRQKAWQLCSEQGLFGVAPTRDSARALRSHNVNITFFKNWCEDIFDEEVFPERGLANIYRGGKHLQATNLVITNGVEDPWQDASIKESKCWGIANYYIECDDCAHCVDLDTPRRDDSWALWWARLKIRYNIGKWLLTTPAKVQEEE